MKHLSKIINTPQTVFSTKELKIITGIQNIGSFNSFLYRLKKQDILNPYYKGLRCKKNFDVLELASKIKSKSYISLQTVLQKNGIIFQDRSNTVTMVSDNSLEKNVSFDEEKINIKIHKIKKSVLTNPLYIINKGNYQIASPERAVCDILYLDNNFYFDNIEGLDTKKLEELAEIYNKITKKNILLLIKQIQNGKI